MTCLKAAIETLTLGKHYFGPVQYESVNTSAKFTHSLQNLHVLISKPALAALVGWKGDFDCGSQAWNASRVQGKQHPVTWQRDAGIGWHSDTVGINVCLQWRQWDAALVGVDRVRSAADSDEGEARDGAVGRHR